MRAMLLRVLALAWLAMAQPAFAEHWIVAYRLQPTSSTPESEISIDADSIQVSGNLFKYRNRVPRYGGGFAESTVAVDCREHTRGDWTDLRMYEVYPDTRNGMELQTVCLQAQGVGLLKEFSIVKAKAAPVSTAPPPVANTEVPRVSSSGSGFFVDAQSVVTNFHVVEGCTHFTVRRDTTTFPAKLQATTERNDLALLSVQGVVAGAPSIRVGAALGEDVMVAGHPLSGLLASDLIVTSGQVNSLAGLGNDPSFLQISAPVQPGNSGGPLIDRSGSIVGVVVSKVNVLRLARITGDVAQNVNFAIKPEILRMFLEANRISYKSSAGGRHLEGVALAERARSFTVQVLCEN